jgi:hypothetical protein
MTAFTPESVRVEIEEQMRRFLENPTKGLTLDVANAELTLSKIFLWYEKDFIAYVKKHELGETIIDFVIRYAPKHVASELKSLVESKVQIKIRYLDYNWHLNNVISSAKSIIKESNT